MLTVVIRVLDEISVLDWCVNCGDRLKEKKKPSVVTHSVCVSLCLSVNKLKGTPFDLGTSFLG